MPDVNIINPIPCNYELKLLQPEDYDHLYGKPGLYNALGSGKKKHLDRIAVAAFDGKALIGLATSTASCEHMWQIGVDMLQDYRKKGIASALISRLAAEVLHIGVVPFTGCRWANIPSLKPYSLVDSNQHGSKCLQAQLKL